MSVQYRYRCQTENTLVWETRTLAQGPPTVCVNESGAIVAGTLTVLDKPKEVADLVIGSTIDFSTATVSNLSHGDLDDVGTNTHAQIDTHIANAALHRTINDAGSASTDLWSASKIASELGTKAATSHTHTTSQITDFATATDTRADARITTQKGQANGLATLDGTGKIPAGQLTMSGGLQYQGTWNADTNTPTLTSSTGSTGAYYVVSTAGATDLDSVTDWEVSDWVVFNGTFWEKADHSDQVTSVAGKQGAVTLVATDVSDFASAVSAHSDVSANTAHVSSTSNPHSVTLDQVTTASAKGDLLAHNGTSHVVRAVGTNGHVLQADSSEISGLKWASNKKFIITSRSTLKSTSTVWQRVDHFIYPGSVIAAANVSRILVDVQAETVGVMYEVRLYDITNGQEIAKLTGQTNTKPAIINLGTISNVPSADAVFEVHVIRTAGIDPNGILYYSCMLEYQ